MSGTLHLLIGPVGAGKTTVARRLEREHRAVRFDLDDWMADLYGADPRPESGRLAWYGERVDRCLGLIHDLSVRVADLGSDVVLEVGLVQRAPRLRFYERCAASGHELVVLCLDAPRELRRERVRSRNSQQGETWSMHVPDAIFELASDAWQPPEADEIETWGVRFLGA